MEHKLTNGKGGKLKLKYDGNKLLEDLKKELEVVRKNNMKIEDLQEKNKEILEKYFFMR